MKFCDEGNKGIINPAFVKQVSIAVIFEHLYSEGIQLEYRPA